MKLDDLKSAIEDATSAGIFSKYLEKLKHADAVIDATKEILNGNRNLAEDFAPLKPLRLKT